MTDDGNVEIYTRSTSLLDVLNTQTTDTTVFRIVARHYAHHGGACDIGNFTKIIICEAQCFREPEIINSITFQIVCESGLRLI